MKITPATVADAQAIAAINIEGWRASYGGLVAESFLAGLDLETRTANWEKWLGSGTGALIARDADGCPAGFVSFGKLRTPLPGGSPVRPLYTGEIMALYILPRYWRKGLGRALMGRAAAGLLEMRHRSLCLWVLEKNARGVAFYKALGGERCGKKTVEIGGQALSEMCYGWRTSAALLALNGAENRT